MEKSLIKINYNLEMEKIIDSLDYTPKLLLHSCCGPCSSAVLERLRKYFKITVLYYNPNLDSKEEFDRRVIEQNHVASELDSYNGIDVVVVDYNSDEYYKAIAGYEDEKEGGYRCKLCFDLRLDKTAQYARDNGYDFFTTTLSISPHKNSKLLNKIGEKMAKEYGVSYLYSDFKKKEGYKRSVELSKEYGLYRQDYCGCEFSKREMEERGIKE